MICFARTIRPIGKKCMGKNDPLATPIAQECDMRKNLPHTSYFPLDCLDFFFLLFHNETYVYKNRLFHMARISGVNLPNNKPLFIALQYIYGIGAKIAEDICKGVKIDRTKRTQDLSEQDEISIRQFIDTHHVVEGNLRKEVAADKKRLIALRCFRGLRHSSNLPCRGQRTHSNARTRRGRAKAIAGKKG